MTNYTVETFLSHDPGTAPRTWALSFGAANLTLAALMLFLLPLLKNPPNEQSNTATLVEWLPEDPDSQPLPPTAPAAVTPPPPPTTSTPPRPPDAPPPPTDPEPPADTPPAPPLTADFEARPLAFNDHDTPDDPPPAQPRFAGIDNAQARSRQPTPGATDPVPAQPDGIAPPVAALGTVGDDPAAPRGITLQETPNPGPSAPPASPENTDPTPAQAAHTPAIPVPAAGATAGAPTTPTTPPRPANVEPQPPTGIEPEPSIAPATTSTTVPPPTPVPEQPASVVAGQAPNGVGVNPTSTTPTGSGAGTAGDGPAADGTLAAELARLEKLQAADRAQSPTGEPGRKSIVQILQNPTAGDPNAVTKTPLWNLRLNAGQAGPDTIETGRDPVARYLKDFRRILEQNFFREAGLPRSYRFRDGEYADFEMTFHQDGKIDGVTLLPKSGTANFTPEMETICKAAIQRSSPYVGFTDELKKVRQEFKLIVRFHF